MSKMSKEVFHGHNQSFPKNEKLEPFTFFLNVCYHIRCRKSAMNRVCETFEFSNFWAQKCLLP